MMVIFHLTKTLRLTFHLIKTWSALSSFSYEKSSELKVLKYWTKEGNLPQCFRSTSSDASHFRVRNGYLQERLVTKEPK